MYVCVCKYIFADYVLYARVSLCVDLFRFQYIYIICVIFECQVLYVNICVGVFVNESDAMAWHIDDAVTCFGMFRVCFSFCYCDCYCWCWCCLFVSSIIRLNQF